MTKNLKRIVAVMLAVVLSLTLFACSKKPLEEPTTTTETTTKYIPPTDPFTGEEIDLSSVGARPVAVVVENLNAARPQWGIGSSDIICEGEVEGGISRMLWVYADMTKIPDEIGPLRSARPSYVQFSKFFDSIFIHWGGSHSKGDYVGGYETISNEGVEDIDGMGGGSLFGRNKTRNVSSEHTGVMYASALAEAIEAKGYRNTINEDNIVKFDFNENIVPAGATTANGVNVKFSSRTDTRRFTYSLDDGKYHTNDWETDVAFQNLILIKADSTYITTPYNGSTTTYLNYSWTSGSGVYVSNGAATDITWSAEGGKLVFKDAAGANLAINKGHSYIGFVSSNNAGMIDCIAE